MSNHDRSSVPDAAPIKAWVRGVPLEDEARKQLINAARMPFIHRHIAVMPDVHMGIGATVGSVIPTIGAIIPAAVGVDIGCGMCAVRTSLTAKDLPESLAELRSRIERAVPHGRTDEGGRNDRGAWGKRPVRVDNLWKEHLATGFAAIVERTPFLAKDGDSATRSVNHLGTLGTGNHFIEVCLDEADQVWVMLHSGSRGIGNAIATYFIELARKDMERWMIQLPDRDLAYFPEGSEYFADYVEAVHWAQEYAMQNRQSMLELVLAALTRHLPPFTVTTEAVNCHHNYVAKEHHFGENVWVTRKGTIRAREGDLGIVPGSMGARSFIVRGKGSAESFCSSAHGAGRRMSRRAAEKQFNVSDVVQQTQGVICRKDKGVIDEIPGAYKDIDEVMANQSDLTEIPHTLKQVVCVKG